MTSWGDHFVLLQFFHFITMSKWGWVWHRHVKWYSTLSEEWWLRTIASLKTKHMHACKSHIHLIQNSQKQSLHRTEYLMTYQGLFGEKSPKPCQIYPGYITSRPCWSNTGTGIKCPWHTHTLHWFNNIYIQIIKKDQKSATSGEN